MGRWEVGRCEVGRWVIVWSSAPTSVLMSSTKRFETEAKAADLAPGRAPSAAAFSRASARATISRATSLVEVESTWRCMGDAWEMHGRCSLGAWGCSVWVWVWVRVRVHVRGARVCGAVQGYLLEVLVERVVVLLEKVGAAVGDVPRKVAHLGIASKGGE